MSNLLNQRVLLIGGAGYVGTVLAQKLTDQQANVTILDNFLYEHRSIVNEVFANEKINLINGDFSQENTLRDALEGVDHVVLLACLVGDPISKKYPELAIKTNEHATQQCLQILNDFPIQKLVFTSTCSNYGLMPDGQIADEQSDLNPQSIYAKNKVNIERYIQSRLNDLNYCPVILRLSTAFGLSQRMRFDLTVSEFVWTLANDKHLLVYDEDTWRPYCHVQDIAEAISLCLQGDNQNLKGEVFNVGSDENNYTKKMFVETIRKFTQKGTVAYQQKGNDPRNYRVSFKKMRECLGFQPTYSIEDGIKELMARIEQGDYQDVETNKEHYGNYVIASADAVGVQN